MTERLLIITLLATILCACREQDPLALLEQSRAAHALELRTWVEATAAPAPAEPAVSSEEGAEEDAEPSDVLPEPAEAHLSLLVADRGARMELPCLTIDIVLEAGEGPATRVVDTLVREIDISGLAEAGGGLDLVLRIPLPGEPVSGIGVALHEATREELPQLCEAAAIARVSE